ncbi:hypothetical protein ACQ86O_16640 [Serratia sp. L9]|uniref:hypothetical protein n=1 Tax=Serratia sp. L9 TaxID=3423946 RepID=UPI003D67D935
MRVQNLTDFVYSFPTKTFVRDENMDVVKKQRGSTQDRKYRETLGDAHFAVTVLVITACTLIILILSITLWVT